MKSTVFNLITTGENLRGFKTVNLLVDGEVRIALPSRTSLVVIRSDDRIVVELDLGHMPNDEMKVCEVNLQETKYGDAVRMDENFLYKARPYDNHFHLKKAVEYYYGVKNGRGWNLVGDEWLDQVWINLKPPFHEKRTNMEFSMRRAKFMDDNPLEYPALTLLGSLQLHAQRPYYFVFGAWWEGDIWSYGRNLFYNNVLIPALKDV